MIKLTWRIWALVILLALSILSIFSFPPLFFSKGVIVKSVEVNSTAFNEGLKQGEIIKSINNQPINNFDEYSNIVAPLNNKTNESIKWVITTNKNTYSFFNQGSLQIVVSNIPKTTLKTGLDLQGGARALVSPEKQLTTNEMQYLIGQQGKFEAKIGNETVFVGGNKDITYVCRDDASCAGIEACNPIQGGEICNYRFVIHLSEEAAKRHADITSKLSVNSSSPTAGDRYLEKQIDFFVDDKLSTSLYISEDLKGQVTTQIQIQGSGTGADRNSAIQSAEDSMKKMQTILITGSLPYKLSIVKLDTISPVLGERFNYLILLTGLAGLIAVAIIIFVRYRNFKASMALLFTSFAEVVIILGVASLIKWNLDLPSIVGILVTIGTGVDQQIVILDEFKSKRIESLREKLKSALFIVVSAFFTAVVSLLPLFWAGAGLLKGFAVTTIIGLTIGVLISRPAFADMLKFLGERHTQ